MVRNTIDIILPAYHEEGNIEKVLAGIKKYVKTPHHITIVLQDKKDPTIEVIQKQQKTARNIQMIFTTDGKGMLKALKKGFASTKNSIMVIMMADLSDDPKDIDKMIAQINNGFDLVCGSRYIHNGKRIGGPKMKGFLSYLACISLKQLIGLPTYDATNAFKCFRRSLLKKIDIESKQGFEMPLELTVKAFKKGFKIADVPTTWRDREKGVSKFYLLRDIPLYLRWYMYALITKKQG
jgi:dolichol-phosphate mannosyltransferase